MLVVSQTPFLRRTPNRILAISSDAPYNSLARQTGPYSRQTHVVLRYSSSTLSLRLLQQPTDNSDPAFEHGGLDTHKGQPPFPSFPLVPSFSSITAFEHEG